MELDAAPRGVAPVSQGSLTDKALEELAALQEEFFAEAMKLRERRGSWSRLDLLFRQMDLLGAELSMLCRVLGLLSPWVPQVENGQPTLARLEGDLVDPTTKSIWQWPSLGSAIRWLEDQKVMSWLDYKKLATEDKKRAVALPQERKLESLRVLKGAIVDSFARGESVEKFKSKARLIVDAQSHVIERTYRTKSKQAYLQGVDQLTSNPRVKNRFPWLKYVATKDNRTRPEHRAQNGKIVRADSPEAAYFKELQSAFNCRCSLIPLTNDMAAAQGVVIPPELKASRVPLRAE